MENVKRIFSDECERIVLSHVMSNSKDIDSIFTDLEPKHFFSARHQTIYRIALDLYRESCDIEPILICERARQSGVIEDIGGQHYVFEIAMNSLARNSINYYVEVIKDKYIIRSLISSCNEISRKAYNSEEPGVKLVEFAEESIDKISEESIQAKTDRVSLISGKVVSTISKRQSLKGGICGHKTGFVDLDKMTGGFQNGQLIIVAARPSMGKTAFALNICENFSKDLGNGVIFFTLEMSSEEIVERLISSLSRIDNRKIKGIEKMSFRERLSILSAKSRLDRMKFFVDDGCGRTVTQVHANARKYKRQFGINMVVVDYIQLMESDPESAKMNRQEQVSKMSRRLKVMARDLNVPVIALSQLNRGVESKDRTDKRPRMSDLRESGSIEQDADMVLLLHRPEYYNPQDSPGVAEVIVAKNRNGSTGTVRLAFVRNLSSFANSSWDHAP